MKRLNISISIILGIVTCLLLVQACSHLYSGANKQSSKRRDISSRKGPNANKQDVNEKKIKSINLPIVMGSYEFRKRIKSALNLLHANPNELYISSISKYVTKIKEGERSGSHVYGATPWIELNISSCPDDNIEWCASVLYHESLHTFLYRSEKPHTGEQAELYCNLKQLEALKEIEASEETINWLKQIIEDGDHSDLDGDGDYDWDDYNLRNW